MNKFGYVHWEDLYKSMVSIVSDFDSSKHAYDLGFRFKNVCFKYCVDGSFANDLEFAESDTERYVLRFINDDVDSKIEIAAVVADNIIIPSKIKIDGGFLRITEEYEDLTIFLDDKVLIRFGNIDDDYLNFATRRLRALCYLVENFSDFKSFCKSRGLLY